jgi:hypothetical protein
MTAISTMDMEVMSRDDIWVRDGVMVGMGDNWRCGCGLRSWRFGSFNARFQRLGRDHRKSFNGTSKK